MMRSVRWCVAAAFVTASAAASVVGSGPARASGCTRTWAAPVDGEFSDATKWSPQGVPSAADAVCVTAPGYYTVRVHGTHSMASFAAGADEGTQRIILEGECKHGNAYFDTPSVRLGANVVTTLTARGCGWSGLGNWHSVGTNAGTLFIARGEYPSARYVPTGFRSTGWVPGRWVSRSALPCRV
jgi:hypothetical protein